MASLKRRPKPMRNRHCAWSTNWRPGPLDGHRQRAQFAGFDVFYDKLNFNFVRDIAPVAPIVRFPYIMVLNTSRRQAEATSPNDTSRTSGHVRLESAQWAKRTLIPVIDRAATAVCS
jgi:hypothetical protein